MRSIVQIGSLPVFGSIFLVFILQAKGSVPVMFLFFAYPF